MLKKSFFKILFRVNKLILPRASKINLNKMSKTDKVLVAYKYWVILHVLE